MKTVFLFATLIFCGQVMAASEIMHQTPAGKIELTGALEYLKMTTEVKTVPVTSAETKGLREWVRAEYGLSEMFSAGLDLNMASYKTDGVPTGQPATTQSGLWDPSLFFHGVSLMGTNALRYGIDLNFALGKAETENSGDSNFTTGGLGAQPFVGYEMGMGNCLFGARMSYWLGISETKESITASNVKTDYTNTGGSTLMTTAFYEHTFNPMLVGAALSIINEAKTDRKTGSVTTAKEASHSEYQLQVYGNYAVNEMIAVLPSMTYGTYTALDNTTVDSVKYWKLAVGARFAF